MKICLAYCGGCNPRFDRTALTGRIRREYPEILFETKMEEADVQLLICGCERRCAHPERMSPNSFVLFEEKQEPQLRAWLNSQLKSSEGVGPVAVDGDL